MSDAVVIPELASKDPSAAVPLRESTWHWAFVLVGILALFAVQSSGWLLPQEWRPLAVWICFLALEIFLCVFPFLTRRESGVSIPAPRRLVIEALWAIPLTLGCLVM